MEAVEVIPVYLPNPHNHPIWEELADELASAMAKFPPMNSPHEGHSVIREELDKELWEHVCSDTGRSPEARHEALQVAAMALRYILDLIDEPTFPRTIAIDRNSLVDAAHHKACIDQRHPFNTPCLGYEGADYVHTLPERDE